MDIVVQILADTCLRLLMFSESNISQGIVQRRAWGLAGYFYDHVITNLLLRPPVNGF